MLKMGGYHARHFANVMNFLQRFTGQKLSKLSISDESLEKSAPEQKNALSPLPVIIKTL